MHRAILAVALLALPATVPASLASEQGPGAAGVYNFAIYVDGELATGLIAVPASGTSDVLVVMCHGLGGSAAAFAGELQQVAARGWLGVAMDFRGPQSAYKVFAGAEDTLAATRFLQARHPIQRTVLWGFSMGGHVSGLAVMDGPGLYDYWVVAAGISDWAAQWAWVTAHDGPDITQDAGGTPLEQPLVYIDRSPALNPTGLLDSGLQRAYLVYGAGDMNVGPGQGQELALSLARQAVPVSMYTAIDSTDLAELPGHMKMGFDLVLARAAGEPPGPVPFVEGIADLGTHTYLPAS